MKKIALLCLFIAFGMCAYAQQEPVKFAAIYNALSKTEGEVVIKAQIEKGHHIYSQRETEAGPINTTIVFAKSPTFKLIGKAQEIGGGDNYDKVLETKVFSFSNTAEFRQKIKLAGARPGTVISCKVEYVCCSEIMCMLPKTVDLTVKVL